MANASVNTIRIQGIDGDVVDVTSNALDVNIAGGASIDIGDVDMFLDGGTAIVGGNGAATAGTLRVTIASDTTGVLSVDDNGSTLSIDDGGGSITVDGTVSVNSHAVTNAGTFAVQVEDGSGTALTSNSGKLDVCLHSEDGTAITETSNFLNVSVRSGSAISVIGAASPAYVWATGMEYADFDGSALPFAVAIDTEGDSTPMQGSKYGVQYNMLVNEDGSKSPIDQTSGQMVTTHGITGMVSDLDEDVGTTAEKIHTASDVAIKRIDIQANRSNTGYIYVGDSGVAGDGTGGGISLAAGDFYSLDIDNTGDVYVAASVADEDVSYIYYT